MNPDLISLRGLQAYGYHGVLAHERRDGQVFVVDLDLAVDIGAAAAADDLSRTVDYAALAVRVRDAVAADPVDLIETVADPSVSWVRVSVHKPEAPVLVPVHDVAVTIERSRP